MAEVKREVTQPVMNEGTEPALRPQPAETAAQGRPRPQLRAGSTAGRAAPYLCRGSGPCRGPRAGSRLCTGDPSPSSASASPAGQGLLSAGKRNAPRRQARPRPPGAAPCNGADARAEGGPGGGFRSGGAPRGRALTQGRALMGGRSRQPSRVGTARPGPARRLAPPREAPPPPAPSPVPRVTGGRPSAGRRGAGPGREGCGVAKSRRSASGRQPPAGSSEAETMRRCGEAPPSSAASPAAPPAVAMAQVTGGAGRGAAAGAGARPMPGAGPLHAAPPPGYPALRPRAPLRAKSFLPRKRRQPPRALPLAAPSAERRGGGAGAPSDWSR